MCLPELNIEQTVFLQQLKSILSLIIDSFSVFSVTQYERNYAKLLLAVYSVSPDILPQILNIFRWNSLFTLSIHQQRFNGAHFRHIAKVTSLDVIESKYCRRYLCQISYLQNVQSREYGAAFSISFEINKYLEFIYSLSSSQFLIPALECLNTFYFSNLDYSPQPSRNSLHSGVIELQNLVEEITKIFGSKSLKLSFQVSTSSSELSSFLYRRFFSSER